LHYETGDEDEPGWASDEDEPGWASDEDEPGWANSPYNLDGGGNSAGLQVFWALAICGPALIVWYVTRGYVHSPFGRGHWSPGQVLYPVVVIASGIYCLTSAIALTIIFDSILAFLLGVPLIYALTLLTQAPLLAPGLIPFSTHTYFGTSALGAVAGCCWLATANAKATLKRPAEGGRESIHVAFWDGAALAAPFAFVTAIAFPVHGHRAAGVWIVIGTMAGIVAAAATSLFAALAHDGPAGDESLNLMVLELVLLGALPVCPFTGGAGSCV
jgi:hypothetical protein